MKRIAAFAFCLVAVQAFWAFPVEIGKKAPDFSLPTTNDSLIELSRFGGRVCVLYFSCFG